MNAELEIFIDFQVSFRNGIFPSFFAF